MPVTTGRSPDARPATLRRVHRGRWTVRVPADRRDLYFIDAKEEGAMAFTFAGTHRELVALRTALAAALSLPKGTP